MDVPEFLSLLNWRSPAFCLQTYFLSDLWRTHLPFQKIPKENDPPKQRISPNFFIFIALSNSFSQLISLFFLSSYFFNSIFQRMPFCLLSMAYIELKSSSLTFPSAKMCSQSVLVMKLSPNPPLLQLRVGSTMDRLMKISSPVSSFLQKMAVLFYNFLARQLLQISNFSTLFQLLLLLFSCFLANLWSGILTIST